MKSGKRGSDDSESSDARRPRLDPNITPRSRRSHSRADAERAILVPSITLRSLRSHSRADAERAILVPSITQRSLRSHTRPTATVASTSSRSSTSSTSSASDSSLTPTDVWKRITARSATSASDSPLTTEEVWRRITASSATPRITLSDRSSDRPSVLERFVLERFPHPPSPDRSSRNPPRLSPVTSTITSGRYDRTYGTTGTSTLTGSSATSTITSGRYDRTYGTTGTSTLTGSSATSMMSHDYLAAPYRSSDVRDSYSYRSPPARPPPVVRDWYDSRHQPVPTTSSVLERFDYPIVRHLAAPVPTTSSSDTSNILVRPEEVGLGRWNDFLTPVTPAISRELSHLLERSPGGSRSLRAYEDLRMGTLECSICLGNLRLSDIILSCGHPIHEACLDQWKGGRCPECRKRITDKVRHIMSATEYSLEPF